MRLHIPGELFVIAAFLYGAAVWNAPWWLLWHLAWFSHFSYPCFLPQPPLW